MEGFDFDEDDFGSKKEKRNDEIVLNYTPKTWENLWFLKDEVPEDVEKIRVKCEYLFITGDYAQALAGWQSLIPNDNAGAGASDSASAGAGAVAGTSGSVGGSSGGSNPRRVGGSGRGDVGGGVRGKELFDCIARCHMALDDPASAQGALQRASPSAIDVDQLLALSDCYVRLGRYTEAVTSLQTVITASPSDPTAWLCLANALLCARDGRCQYAALSLARALQLITSALRNFHTSAIALDRHRRIAASCSLERRERLPPSLQTLVPEWSAEDLEGRGKTHVRGDTSLFAVPEAHGCSTGPCVGDPPTETDDVFFRRLACLAKTDDEDADGAGESFDASAL